MGPEDRQSSAPAPARGAPSRWLERRWAPLVLYALALAALSAVAGRRIAHQSSDPHFVYQADAWLHGQLAIDPPPQKGDDWAVVETVLLDDGSQVRGRRLTSPGKRGVFRTTAGEDLPAGRIRRSLGSTSYVCFPPFPAVLMLPQAAVHGRRANDVVPTLLVAALVLPLAFMTLGRLRAAGLSRRTPVEDLWLAMCLAFGTVFFFCAVQGRVWFTAHAVGVVLGLGYLHSTVEARRPIAAGLCLGLAAMTRTPMAFLFPLFLLEAWRMTGRADLRRFAVLCARFAAPVIVIAAVGVALNLARFDQPTEFGHSYLAVRQQAQMEASGLFSLDYLTRNLAVGFTLLPRLSAHSPFVVISGHGLALWFTTPLLFFLLWPRERGPWHRPLWISVAVVALPSLLYQNSGWLQFGYRFALDYLPLLIALVAVGGRPLGRTGKALIALGIAVNLFGAITFARYPQFYRSDDYGVVIRH
ncbi:MAG TPA: hypothetical protein VKB80_35900 [Kofleriaceae bacterium]|nr:hypothetical protein [Kofleriaceae bacterium]